MIFLPRSVAALANLAARESTTQMAGIAGIRVQELPDAFWRIEATNGKLLGVIRGPSCPTPLDQAAAHGLPDPESLALEVLLPAQVLGHALKSVTNKPRGVDRKLGVMLAKPQTLLVAGESILRCDLLNGRFPDINAVLPRRPAIVSFKVNADLLIALLRAAGDVARGPDKAQPAVEILFWKPDAPIGVTSQGQDGLTFDGILMPLT
jgi:hypothetical protein